jgi:hypothetical protein
MGSRALRSDPANPAERGQWGNRMFTLRARNFARQNPPAAAQRTSALSCTNTPLGRRHSAMIAPRIWRRRGPVMNLHDRLGTCTEGMRRGKPRLSRIGITFWHRPFRAAI